ncbi:ABC transporter ATP-binding protein [Streptomyces sp. NPDC006283]|uniref:ABC transporter ATP-binding protein n=1 Tax=Streptomyces sp. NPDC006283 TaxID=3156741 RepID=UPI0033B2FE90
MHQVIELEGAVKRYDSADAPALGPLTLSVARGEALAVTGPSGSGKSTLLNLVAGLDKPTDGAVIVAGQRIDRLSEHALAKFRREHIGMVFQFFNLLDDLTVTDNIQLPAQLTGTSRRKAASRAGELMEMLGILKHARAYPGRLSGGERQRVAVARALVNRPALLLADEPTGALDTASGHDVRNLLMDLHRAGQTIVLVTHDLTLADACASRTVHLVDGHVALDSYAQAVR